MLDLKKGRFRRTENAADLREPLNKGSACVPPSVWSCRFPWGHLISLPAQHGNSNFWGGEGETWIFPDDRVLWTETTRTFLSCSNLRPQDTSLPLPEWMGKEAGCLWLVSFLATQCAMKGKRVLVACFWQAKTAARCSENHVAIIGFPSLLRCAIPANHWFQVS